MSRNKKVRKSKAEQEQCITLTMPKIKKTVMKMAEQCHIKFRQKGQSQQNFHFPLNHPKAGKFIRKIASLGVIEDFKIPCWLMRTIRKNLEESANSIFGGSRASKAERLLAEFKSQPEKHHRMKKQEPQTNSVIPIAAVASDKPVSKLRDRLQQCLRIVGKKMNNAEQSIRQWRKTTKLAYAR